MSSPISHHHHHHIHHHAPVEERETKVIPLHDPDKAQDVLEASTSTKTKPKTLLDSLLTDNITVGAFTDSVEIPREKSKQKLYDNDRQINENTKKLNNAKLDTALSVANIKVQLESFLTQWNALATTENSQTAGLNSKISSYNSQILPGDSTALANLNAGTALYNQGKLTLANYESQYVFPYNAYVTGNNNGTGTGGRNAAISSSINDYKSTLNTYNTVDVPANNATTTALNQTGQTFDIPPIPTEQTQPLQNTSKLPVMSIPPPVAGHAPVLADSRTPLALSPATTLPTPPQEPAFMATYYQPIFDAASAALNISSKKLAQLVAQDDYRRFNLRGNDPKKINESNTVIDKQPQLADDATQGGFKAGGGVALATASGLGSPHLERTISDSIFGANSDVFQLQFSNSTTNNLKTYGNLILHTSGLEALRPALHALNLDGLTAHQTLQAFGVTSGVSVASTITGLVNSGATADAVRKLVESELKGKADQQTIDRTVNILTSALNISLLQFAATSAAIGLNAPGLLTHLAANVKGLPSNASTTPLSPAQVLGDTQRSAFVTSTLAGTLSADNKISSQQAQTIISTAIQGAVASGNLSSSDNLRSELVTNLLSQGITNSEALRLADQAVTIIQQESTSSRVLHTQVSDQNLTVNLLIPLLEQQADLRRGKAHDLAIQAIENTIKNQNITSDAEFQLALQFQLEQAGISGPTAALIASKLVAGAVATAPPEPSPLSSQDTQQISTSQFRSSLARHATGLLADPLGQETARRHGNRIVEILIGPPGSTTSLLGLINTNVAVLQRESNNRAGEHLRANFREFLSPNLDGFAFNRKVLDPANTFLLTALGSTRMTDVLHQPKDYIKYLEFYV